MLVILAKEEACRTARSHPATKPSLSQQADSAPAWHWISTFSLILYSRWDLFIKSANRLLILISLDLALRA